MRSLSSRRGDVVARSPPYGGLLDDRRGRRTSCGSARSRSGSSSGAAVRCSGASAASVGRCSLGRSSGARDREVDRVAVRVDDGRVRRSRNCSAFPRARSERTASDEAPPFEILAGPSAGFSPVRSARRSISASTSSSVASIASWATTARSARSARTALVAPSRGASSTNGSWSWPVAARYCGIVDALRARAGAPGRGAGAPSPGPTSVSGDVDRRRAPAAASSTLSRSAICACTCAYRSSRWRDVGAQRVDRLELADLG